MGNHFMVEKTINGIQIADDNKALLFICTDGDHLARADGDCCSETWIENISAPALGFPCTVQSVESLDMPEDEDTGGEVIAFYGLKISTDKGEIVIEYRNSSNGYYGGNLVWPDDGYFYGGVFGQNISSEQWVTPDFG